MNKQEAISALRQGKKLTHRSFTGKEWIQGEGLMLTTEDGYSVTIEEFMSYRSHSAFDDGWSLFGYRLPLISNHGVVQGIGKGLEIEQKPIEVGRCLNCKYWSPKSDTLGLCDGIETSAYYKDQIDDVQISYIPEGHSGDVMNYSEFQLTTRDTFGCLNFKEE